MSRLRVVFANEPVPPGAVAFWLGCARLTITRRGFAHLYAGKPTPPLRSSRWPRAEQMEAVDG